MKGQVVIIFACLALAWDLCNASKDKVVVACERNHDVPHAAPLLLKCEGHQMLNIRSAIYGRTNGEVCSSALHNKNWCNCPGRPQADLWTVRKACQGKRSCEVVACNNYFGDPCKGTYKYLQVSYVCTD